MPQVFDRRTLLAVRLAMTVLVLGLVAVLAFAFRGASEDSRIEEFVQQPIPFSHKHHVGDVGLDCRYCHASVETSASAGLPGTQVCLSCHSQLFADQPMFEPLRRSAATDEPIAWQRVHQLPDFVYFDHSIHVAKGVACIECHGRVDQMPLMKRVAPLRMKWCVECHRDPAPHLREKSAVFSMKPLSDEDHATVRMLSRLQSEQRLTDCSTCHR